LDVHVVIHLYDQEGNLLKTVADYQQANPVVSFSLAWPTFVPEINLLQVLTDDQGTTLQFNGTNAAGDSLPDGRYTLRVTSNGIETAADAFWLRHGLGVGSVVVAPNPVGAGPVEIFLSFGEVCDAKIQVYSLAGELVWRGGIQLQSGSLRWHPQSPDGSPLASGIYICQVRAKGLVSGSDQIFFTKLAVLR
jgi:hypothetical protein